MKFTIEVETDSNNKIIKAFVGKIELQAQHVPGMGKSWLVFEDKKKSEMIVLSQMEY